MLSLLIQGRSTQGKANGCQPAASGVVLRADALAVELIWPWTWRTTRATSLALHTLSQRLRERREGAHAPPARNPVAATQQR